jgi:hypothetical protein
MATASEGLMRYMTMMVASALLSACGGTALVGREAARRQVVRQANESGLPDSVLLIDLPTVVRRRLEGLMSKGLVAMAFTDDVPVMLAGCLPRHAYVYEGFPPAEEAFETSNRRTEGGELPFGAGATLGATEEAGGSAEIKLITVGHYEAPAMAGSPAEPPPGCEAATHYVHAAQMGAFAVDEFDSGQARDEVGLVGINMSEGQERAERQSRRDGDPAMCKTASGRDVAPPEGCGGVLRVVLKPLAWTAGNADAGPSGTNQDAQSTFEEGDEPVADVEEDPARGAGPAKRQEWSGVYECSGSQWRAKLVTFQQGTHLQGTLEVAEIGDDVRGTWGLEGDFSDDGTTFSLEPTDEVDVPFGYSPVGFEGRIISSYRMVSTAGDCGAFELNLIGLGR